MWSMFRQSVRRVQRRNAGRRGSVLIIVLVLVMLLTLGVYGFTQRMLMENKAAVSHGESAQAMSSAASGIELAASTVSTRAADPANPVSLYHRPDLFAGIIMYDSVTPEAVGRFSLVAPVAGDATASQVRFGLSDESGKLNINTIVSAGSSGRESSTNSQSEPSESESESESSESESESSESDSESESSESDSSESDSSSGSSSQNGGGQTDETDEETQAMRLMGLPGMTEEIADAILDYLDEDETVRFLGAEGEYYQGLPTPYFPKNGPLESIDELLMVRGVTPALLYGEDANRNGLLDPGEDDGPATPPLDNADGVMQIGWDRFLTIHSKESNTRPDGTKKININQSMLTELYDVIIEETDDEEMAKFIVAYRMYGPNDENAEGEDSGDEDDGEGEAGEGGDGGRDDNDDDRGDRGDDGDDGDDGEDDSESGDRERRSAAMDRAAGNLAEAIAGSGGEADVTRGGLDLSRGPRYEIKSLYDLFDREVDVEGDEEKGTEDETLSSPWTSASVLTDYPMLFDLFAVTEKSEVPGRINVNEARYEVLIGIPGMTEQIASAIVASRVTPSGGAVAEDPSRLTTAWLVAQNIVDLETMRALDPYLTGRGDVFRVQSVGFFDGGGPQARLEAVIDGTVVPAKVVMYRDLTELGRGFAPARLLPAGM